MSAGGRRSLDARRRRLDDVRVRQSKHARGDSRHVHARDPIRSTHVECSFLVRRFRAFHHRGDGASGGDVRGDVARGRGRHSSRKNVTGRSPRSAPRMKSKNKGRFTGRMGASAPVMMLLRSMACSGQRSRTIASAFVLDRAYALTGRGMRRLDAHGVVAAVHLVRAEVDQEGREVPSSPADHAASRASRSAVGTLVASAEAGSRSHAAGNSWLRSSPPRARGGGAVGERSAPRAARTASRIPSPVMASARWPTRDGSAGGRCRDTCSGTSTRARGEHVHEVLAEVAAAAYDERATFRRHLDGKHRDRRRDVTDRGPRARLDACTEHGRRGPRRMSWFRQTHTASW